jgi:hypothetical protein
MTKLAHFLSTVLVASAFYYTLTVYSSLPATIPIRDVFTSRLHPHLSKSSVWVPLFLALVLYVIVAAYDYRRINSPKVETLSTAEPSEPTASWLILQLQLSFVLRAYFSIQDALGRPILSNTVLAKAIEEWLPLLLLWSVLFFVHIYRFRANAQAKKAKKKQANATNSVQS